MKIGITTKTSLIYFGVFALIVLFGTTCQKEEDNTNITPISLAAIPCDSLQNVVWGDTLRVKPKTISRGVYKGKPYWQALIYSNNFIIPTKFQNNPNNHIAIADTVEITNSSIFIISRIK